MLCLTRKEGEATKLYTSDGVITISVERLGNGQVKLGFKAPEKVHIFREELDNQALLENRKHLSLMLRIRHQLANLLQH